MYDTEFESEEEKERRKALRNVGINARRITGGSIHGEIEGNESRKLWSEYGLCHDCANFSAVRTEYDKTFAKCELFNKILNTNDVITSCTDYIKRGQLSLRDMKEIAIIIDPSSNKKIGFEVEE